MKNYLSPVMEVTVFAADDVIATSSPIENEPGVNAVPTTDYDLL